MDQITVKAVYSQEANIEAEEKMNSLCNFITIAGNNARTSTLEVIQCCYSVTRWKNPNEKFRRV